jgi:serine/threonine protein kinase
MCGMERKQIVAILTTLRKYKTYQISFAVKQLRGRDKQQFTREVEALKKFSGSGHSHLVSLLSTYEKDGTYNLIFEWAEADLQRYWETVNPSPQFDKETVLWFVDQCHGLADGVCRIHRYATFDTANASKRATVYGFHGDIKPTNVLWFPGPDKDKVISGNLKLSDFGQAGISGDTKANASATPSYRPPEFDLDGGVISPAFDIWSLGCLYLEFVAWLLGGWTLLRSYNRRRMSPDAGWDFMEIDTFFQLVRTDNEETAAVVKPAVIEVRQAI